MATKKPMKKPVKRVRRFQEGGEAALKAEGLAASNKDAPMGFFESLRRLGQGNIDQEGSEAYNRYGAGRGRSERVALSELAGMTASNNAMPVKNAEDGTAQNLRIANAQGAREMDEEMYQRAAREGKVVDSADMNRDYTPIAKPAAAAQIAALLAKKRPAARPSVKFNAAKDSQAANVAPATPAASAPAVAPSAASLNDASTTSTQSASAPNESKFDAGDALGVGFALASIIPIVRGGKTLYQVGNKMYQTFKAAKGAVQKSSPSGVTGVMPSKYIYTGAKKGGMVKKMAHGGSVKSPVSTASKRGDGIALRGKTRGKIY